MKRTRKTNLISSLFWLFLPLTFFGQNTSQSTEVNSFTFEKSDYGLIFVDILVNERPVKAMIDFGDQHVLQLSTSLVAELNLNTEKAGYQVSDVNGNMWDVYKGTLPALSVGAWAESNVDFTTQQGEMEAVSEMIGTEFNAVLGWGYFSRYLTEVDYASATFTLYTNRGLINDVHFSIPFDEGASQLIINAEVGEQQTRFMIDTGSPVTVADPKILGGSSDGALEFKLNGELFRLQVYPQDLSVLDDLGVTCILGGDFLAQWTLVLDPEESTLHFKKPKY